MDDGSKSTQEKKAYERLSKILKGTYKPLHNKPRNDGYVGKWEHMGKSGVKK